MTFDRLLVPLDGSPTSMRALHVAGSLARRTGAPIDVVTVAAPGGDRGRESDELIEVAHRELPDLDCACTVMHAYDVATILTAMVDPSTLLCMSTHGRAGVARAAVGSTTEAVLRGTCKPVLVVGPKVVEDPKPGPVQACVDPRSAPSHRAAAIALELAAWLGDRLVLVEVQPTFAAPLSGGAHGSAALEWIAAELDDGRVPVDRELVHADDVVEQLVLTAHERGAQILASATHGRAGLARAVLGSVTAGLVRKATCPVLVVPPRASG